MNNDDFDLPEKPSKTQRKRDMEALQALGEALLSFAPAKLKGLNLPPEFMAALVEARRIPARKAGRRHNQYIGRLMRELDEETLAAIKHYLSLRGR
ncbi:MAG: ribosome biogenesis factor YjgA [Gammaproteobacteria bacterium]